jgi:hypothetical protein
MSDNDSDTQHQPEHSALYELVRVNDKITLPRHMLLDMLMAQTMEADVALMREIVGLRAETSEFFHATARQVQRLHSANAALITVSALSLVLCTCAVMVGIGNGKAIRQLEKSRHDEAIATLKREIAAR